MEPRGREGDDVGHQQREPERGGDHRGEYGVAHDGEWPGGDELRSLRFVYPYAPRVPHRELREERPNEPQAEQREAQDAEGKRAERGDGLDEP